jgi:hypothetical protein
VTNFVSSGNSFATVLPAPAARIQDFPVLNQGAAEEIDPYIVIGSAFLASSGKTPASGTALALLPKRVPASHRIAAARLKGSEEYPILQIAEQAVFRPNQPMEHVP